MKICAFQVGCPLATSYLLTTTWLKSASLLTEYLWVITCLLIIIPQQTSQPKVKYRNKGTWKKVPSTVPIYRRSYSSI